MKASNARALMSPAIPPHPSLPYDNWLTAFPLRSFLELEACDRAAGTARGHVRDALRDWGLGQFGEAVTLVVSEMVTNSARATSQVRWEAERPPVWLWVLAGRGAAGRGEVIVLVWDAVAREPVLREASSEDEGGRGLGIVEWLSGGQWDCYRPPAPVGGKVTRALIDRPWRDQPPG